MAASSIQHGDLETVGASSFGEEGFDLGGLGTHMRGQLTTDTFDDRFVCNQGILRAFVLGTLVCELHGISSLCFLYLTTLILNYN
ncbi:hypothetical protein D3C75_1223410 [compost metagenome]